MNDNCAKSCGKCSAKCEDVGPICNTYVATASNACKSTENIGSFLRQFCPKSCGTCGTTAAAAVAAAGQQCVDLSSSCDVFKARFTCNPKSNKAALWARANCQATCEFCPTTGERVVAACRL